jgi:hypothetical protein
MGVVDTFVDGDEAVRLGGYPVVADTTPPAEVTTDQLETIKTNADYKVKGDSGIDSIDTGELAYGLMVLAANHYGAYLIRREWTDKGNKIPEILEEYARLIKSIKEYEDQTGTQVSKNVTITSAYKSHGLNPDVEPYLSSID